MKSLLLSFALIVSLTFTSTAQHWSCFYPNDTAYYLDEAGNLQALAHVGSTINGADTVYKIFRTIKFDRSCSPTNDEAYNTNAPVWAGPEILKRPDGEFCFFNDQNDTLKFQTQYELNHSWKFFHNAAGDSIVATITSLDTATLLGVIDSIKTITLSAYSVSGDTAIMQWDGQVIRLSKQTGWVDMPNILSFPNNAGLLTLTHLKPLTYREVFNYSFGDYFQIKKTTNGYNYNYSNYVYQLVIDKQLSNNNESVTYTFLQNNTDTIIKTYDNLSNYVGGALPAKVEPNPSSTDFPLYYTNAKVNLNGDSAFVNKRSTKLVYASSIVQSHSNCWVWNGYFDVIPPEPTYHECLGLLNFQGAVDGTTTETLIYYNLCGQQGGAKVEVGINEVPDTQIKIYPNPATDVVEINNTSNTTYIINLVNLQGQLLQTITSQPGSTTQVDVSQLPLGMYILQLNDGGQRFYKKVVVAR